MVKNRTELYFVTCSPFQTAVITEEELLSYN